MIGKIINSCKTLYKNSLKNSEILAQAKELEWAHIYHDSIRGKEWIQNLAISPGRWAGNYSFFYVLNRILSDCNPNSILELGLGESTKFISTYLDNYLLNCSHLVVEHDKQWLNLFSDKFKTSERTKTIHLELEDIIVKGNNTKSYKGFNESINQKFDLYIVDGPFGSERYSRYDIVSLVKNFEKDDKFIILIDDFNRQGEKDTANDIIDFLIMKKIVHHTGIYSGNKSQLVLASVHYKHVATL